MVKAVTPSATITEGQIGKINELLGAGLRKAGLQSEPAQQVIERQGEVLVADLVAVCRKFIDAVSDIITRIVPVNRNRTSQEAIKATHRKQYVDAGVVAIMPRGEGATAELSFFKVGRGISDNDLEKEYALHGLVPADAYSLAAVNEADLAFADDHPNATHWKDANGKWCYAAFIRWHVGGRRVFVGRCDVDWHDCWWFAGLRK